MQLMGLNLAIPDHTSLSRRARTLNVVIPCRTHAAPLHIVIDSIGLKVYGEGNMERTPARRKQVWTWIKFRTCGRCRNIDIVGVNHDPRMGGW